ncbi:MAG: neutral/alkaline non-lysosomal ceramidase N-terminal domain-containing protein [Cytophagales bacterium]|nr:neutral/alkaline non-lysosomal ceramidase N-terminal domain-containing protein [Cytophagales bacterium]
MRTNFLFPMVSTYKKKAGAVPLLAVCIIGFLCTATYGQRSKPASGNQGILSWKAGAASAIITPEENMWMSGYAIRDKPSDGKLHDLWVKALALEDGKGSKAVFISTDLIGLSRDLADVIFERIQTAHNLRRSQVILSSSHTHSGPVVNSNLRLIYPEFDMEQRQKIASYRTFLIQTVVRCAGQAFQRMEPARLASGTGISRFAVNRRNNTPEEVLNSGDLKGPSDHTVPVLSVRSLRGELKTILFGYACHCTTLSNNKWNGDYAGYTQIELEKKYSGCVAMFYACCAGDQNPEPRGLIVQAEQYGLELAAAVSSVIKGPMRELAPEFASEYRELELEFAEPPTDEALKTVARDAPEWQQRWARHYLRERSEGKVPQKSYPHYPVQSWKMGRQVLIALGGEVVVDYSIRIKNEWGSDLFVAAYSNDVMAYIPSERVLAEGGYEGETSMNAYGQPSVWAGGIENKIIDEVGRQLKMLGRIRKTP